MQDDQETPFNCTEIATGERYEVVAAESRLPDPDGGPPRQQWHYSIDALGLVLVRHSATEFHAQTDPGRVFQAESVAEPSSD